MLHFSLLIIIVMEFATQRELLEYLWKNPNDRNLVQRMVARGDVYKEDGMYILSIQKKKKDLVDEVRELKQKVEMLESNVYTFGKDDYEEAKAQWDYYKDLYEKEKADKQNRIRKCFKRIQQIKPRANWEEFRDWVLSDEEL